VARLAGLPKPVLARAKDVLARLEKGRDKTGGIAAGLDELPLFAAIAEREAEKPDALRVALAEVEADTLSPREALELVYRLKGLAAEG
jgi:DNA mismatch repair protein MutS